MKILWVGLEEFLVVHGPSAVAVGRPLVAHVQRGWQFGLGKEYLLLYAGFFGLRLWGLSIVPPVRVLACLVAQRGFNMYDGVVWLSTWCSEVDWYVQGLF
ncbi:hypothetical protein L7F22_059013 [Adiantum nelumboides]|nr:hypothetical protein [Adiantum nelumboides]